MKMNLKMNLLKKIWFLYCQLPDYKMQRRHVGAKALLNVWVAKTNKKTNESKIRSFVKKRKKVDLCENVCAQQKYAEGIKFTASCQPVTTKKNKACNHLKAAFQGKWKQEFRKQIKCFHSPVLFAFTKQVCIASIHDSSQQVCKRVLSVSSNLLRPRSKVLLGICSILN